MRMKRTVHFTIAALLMALASCKEERTQVVNTVNVRFELVNDGEPFSPGEVVQLPSGERLRIDQLDFYVNAPELSGTSTSDENGISLIRIQQDMVETGWSTTAELASGLSFEIGVPASINDNPDPSQYATSHPLSDFSGMYWSWNSGYKFIQLEGRADLSGTEGASLDHPISYHTGLEANREFVALPEPLAASCERYDLVVTIDVSQWWNGPADLDMETQNQTHTTDEPQTAAAFSDNFVASLMIVQE